MGGFIRGAAHISPSLIYLSHLTLVIFSQIKVWRENNNKNSNSYSCTWRLHCLVRKASCELSYCLASVKRHHGSFSKPISKIWCSDVIQLLQTITRGLDKFKYWNFLGFWASASMCQSFVSLPPLNHSHPPRNHISKLLVPLQPIRCKVTSTPAAGSCFSAVQVQYRFQ